MAATNGASNGKRKRPSNRPASTAKPAWQRITRRQRAEFLEAVRAGKDRSAATAEVGAPRGSFRALCRFDPLFEADYEAARKLGHEPIAEGLRNVLLRRALNVDEVSTRPLHMALMVYDGEYRTAMSAGRLGVSVSDDGKLEVVLAFLSESA